MVSAPVWVTINRQRTSQAREAEQPGLSQWTRRRAYVSARLLPCSGGCGEGGPQPETWGQETHFLREGRQQMEAAAVSRGVLCFCLRAWSWLLTWTGRALAGAGPPGRHQCGWRGPLEGPGSSLPPARAQRVLQAQGDYAPSETKRKTCFISCGHCVNWIGLLFSTSLAGGEKTAFGVELSLPHDYHRVD